MTPLGRVLITGGSGFLGHGLVQRLLDERLADQVCVYSRNEWRQFEMRQSFGNEDRLRFFIGDVRDAERLKRATRGVHTVIHAAALKRVEVGEFNADEMAKTNVGGTMNALLAAEECGVHRFVLVSSDKAFQPVNAYGASKFMAERIVLGGHETRGGRLPKVAACRYGNVAGSTGSVIPIWRWCKSTGGMARITSPEATRFWMTRDEAAQLVLKTALTMRGGELVIPDLPAFRVGDLAEAIGLEFDVVGIGSSEKLHESMDEARCSADARRMTVSELREALKHVV